MFIASHRAFFGTSAVLFATTTTLTIAWCGSMSAMHDMPMPGGWSMSMMWMRMPGQTWPDVATAFLGMWLVMMVAMMLPAFVPMLWRYRQAIAVTSRQHIDVLTTLVGAAYFFVWTLFGAIAFLLGAILTSLEMQIPALSRAVPGAIGAIVLISGTLQFSAWKAHHLACCRGMPICCEALRADFRSAWRHGLRLGRHCVHCCFGLTMLLLVVGVMDLRAMALVTAAISVERLAPAGLRAARCIGLILIAAGLLQIVHAALGSLG
jgi:predicted metal-binding membrane protein